MMRLFCLFMSLLMCFFYAPALAAFKSSADEIKPEQTWNPKPLEKDLLLPMPCGLFMVLRGVNIPSGALIRDRAFTMGISNIRDNERQLYERRFTGHIAAPFTSSNLPGDWRAKLGKSDGDTWYFIGKYEVSNRQWDAVMKVLDTSGEEYPQACPSSAKLDDSLPVSGFSWFDVQDFLNRYNAWLVKNHAASLPSFSDSHNMAFLRLPTEEEWEYAARGGADVPPEWWTEKDIFPFAEGKSLKDYAVYNYGQALKGPAAIGSRNPNPLGIYDTAGNVSEMVDGFFRMSIADKRNGRVERRLHGAAGGVLTKGGSFRSDEDAVMPGFRDEMPLYTAKGPGKFTDLGFRLSLAGVNIPDADRLEELRKEEKNAVAEYKKQSVNLHESRTPLEAIYALEQDADDLLKSNLAKLRAIITDKENAEAIQRHKNLEHSFRSLLYQAETLRAFALRYSVANRQLQKILDIKPVDQANRDKAARLVKQAKSDLADYWQSLEMGASYYRTSLGVIAEAPERDLARLLEQARKEYGAGGVFNEHMRQNIAALEKYLAIVHEKGLDSLSNRAILRGILPESHYGMLPLS